MTGSQGVTFLPRAEIFLRHGLTEDAARGIWDPMSSESSCLPVRCLGGLGTGMPGFGMMMTIITITTRFRGASG